MTNAIERRIKLTYIVSMNVRWLHLEWMCDRLDRERFDVSFVLVCIDGRTPYLQSYLEQRQIPFRRINCRVRSLSILRTIREIFHYCRREKIDIVHTHIYFASLVGLLASFFARVPVRINTRHHLLQNHGTPAIWLDRMTHALATRVIATSHLVRRVLVEREGASARKMSLIHLGIDLDKFRNIPEDQIAEMRRRYNPRGASPVIGIIARHLESKGIQYVIPAFRRLLERYPSARLVLAFAIGPYHDKIREALSYLPEDKYVQIEFEANVFALYQLFDICVHVPIGEELETFCLIYLEALAAGIPSIFTLSGVGREFLVHRKNCWLVDHKDSDQIYEGMVELLEDRTLREALIRAGHRSVNDAFNLQRMVRATEELYVECFNETSRKGMPNHG